MRKSSFLLASFLVLGVSALAQAQRTTATWRGTVVDSSKAVIPYVTVTARNDHRRRSLRRRRRAGQSC